MSENLGPLGIARRSLEAFAAYKQIGPHATPTPQQRQALLGWSGWGPLANAVDPYKRHHLTGGWKDIAEQVTELLSPAEELAAKEATATSFYTTPTITSAMWDLLTRLGFTGGNVLEPGCGSGNFIAAAPDGLPVSFTGVEIDPTSAGVARLLWPQAAIINKPLERTSFRTGAFSAAIGNVPFSQAAPYDAAWPAEEAGFLPPLHLYFMWRAVRAVHPGGLVAVITSRYTMDATNPAGRAFLSRYADFVGAIRLPSGAFDELGYSGLADIIVLKRRPYGDQGSHAGAWAQAQKVADLQTTVNDYWFSHPDMLLGTLTPKGGAMHGHTLDVLLPDGVAPAELLGRAIDKLVAHAAATGHVWQAPETPQAAMVEVVRSEDKEGSFHLSADGGVTQVVDGIHRAVKPNAELKDLVLLRDAALDLFAKDADLTLPDDAVQPVRERARTLYAAYVARYGPLNRSTLVEGPADEETGYRTYNRRTPSLGGFRGVADRAGDPDYPTVLALGAWSDGTQTETPSEILSRRVNHKPVRKDHADNPADAIALCWDEHAELDLPTLARLLNVEEESLSGHLAGVAFEDPEEGRWVPSEEYLSGNVREKLKTARALAEQAPDRWGGNIAALEQVQPVDLGPSDIEVRLGSPWVATRDVEHFIATLFNLTRMNVSQVSVRHEKLTASWEVSAPPARKHPAATTRWGTDRFNAVDLIEKALNCTPPIAYDEIEVPDEKNPGKMRTKRVRNHADTQLAEERTKQLQEQFAHWLWSEPNRTERLCTVYNWTYNAVQLRKFDGSMFTFPGMAAGFAPYTHQKDMVARIVADPATICAHSVGAGKTAVMFLAALTMKRLGLISKPVIAVPNHLLEQVAAEGRRLYPGARILMVTKSDLTPKRRKHFVAKVAAADWDAIVMTHQQFTSIPVSPAIEAGFVASQIEALEAAIGADAELDGSRTVKRLAKLIIKLRARHDALMGVRRVEEDEPEQTAAPVRRKKPRRPDDGLFFDTLGIDYVMIDEFHFFKNLYAPTRVEGFSMPTSKRAEDLFMKLSWLRERSHGGRCFTGFTGTPISNTLAEGYTLLRYLMPHDWLKAKAMCSFDAFAGMYITFESKIEVSPDGSGFRMHRRPSMFTNVPELRLMLGEGMDVRTRHQLKLAGPGRVIREVVTVEGQPELSEFVKRLVQRADDIREGKVKPVPGADNMLSICNDGRKAALWLPLVGLEGTGAGKPEAVAANVARIYHANKDRIWPDLDKGLLFSDAKPGALQMVFCDLGTPRDGDGQVYGEMRELLVKAGVPRNVIRFIHEAKTGLERAFLFQACRDGDVAVLFTSTEKGGTGVHIPDHLIAIHHVDAPWRPADVEQRDGRGDRPGNLCEVLYIFRYVTKGSFDAYMWQGLERKSYFIFQILSGELGARQVADLISDDTVDYAHMKAAATGQELVMDLAKAQAEVARLRNLSAAYQRDLARLRADQQHYASVAMTHKSHARELEAIATVAKESARELVRYNSTLTDEGAAAEAFAAAARLARSHRAEREAGSWRGVKVKFDVAWSLGKPYLYARLATRFGYRWVSADTVKIDMLRKGHELRLLHAINSAIDGAENRADLEMDRYQALQKQADEIVPELKKTFDQADALRFALAERKRLEDLIAADLEPVMAQAA